MVVIATQREPLPARLGRSLPGGPAEARERSLVRAAQEGSSDAVDELFRRHWPSAHRAAYLIVQDSAAAEDIAQEAFVAALRALDRFDRRRPFAPWLHRIVANRAIDWSRARTARREVQVDEGRLEGVRTASRRRAACSRRSRDSRPSSAPWSCCGTCSATRRARSRGCSSCRAARSTRVFAVRSTGSRTSWGAAMKRRSDAAARALADVTVPGAGAAEQRARGVVLDAFEARERVPARRRRSGLRLALGVAGAALLAGVAVASPGGETIQRFVRDVVVRPQARQLPSAPLRLPGGGNLLVRAPLGSPSALWVVHADGSRSMLGRYRDGSWSPHARFVVATAGNRLVAVDPHTGKVHWSITAPAPVRGARWSLEPTVPPCCRVAYLRPSRNVADRRR